MPDISGSHDAPTVGRRLPSRIQRFGDVLYDVGRVLWPCRTGLLILVSAYFLLLLTEQGRESAIALTQAPFLPAQVSFIVALGMWVLLSWFWARLLMQTAFSLDRTHACERKHRNDDEHTRECTEKLEPRMRFLINHVPRAIGFGCALLPAIAFFLVALETPAIKPTFFAAATMFIGGAAYWFFYKRWEVVRSVVPANRSGSAELTDRRSGWFTRIVARLANHPWFKCGQGPQQAYTRLSQLPKFERGVIGVTIVLFVIALALSSFSAHWALRFGTFAIAFSAFAFLVAAGGMLSFWSVQTRLPLDVALAVAAVILTFTPLTDNHAVRLLDSPGADSRATVDYAYENWRKAVRTEAEKPPLVIIATAGGGLRAAAWTSLVLRTIEYQFEGFHKHVFAISGVSGGSLGAAAYSTLLAFDYRRDGPKPRILEMDYLAPAASGLLYSDLLQWFFPLPLLPDRAEIAEKGWEQGWREKEIVLAGRSPFEQPFLHLWRRCDASSGCWRPALLLNGTDVATGTRIITSNLRIERDIFTDARDVYDLIDKNKDFRISTAINNSARFPFLQPAGALSKNGNTRRIVDGGYFENFGATTATDLLRNLNQHFRDRFRPVVIQISSDPTFKADLCSSAQREEAPEATSRLHAPLIALFATREARGVSAAKELCHMATESQGTFFHFKMCKEAPVSASLSWTLSRESFEGIASLIENDDVEDVCGNRAELNRLKDELGPAVARELANAER